MKILLNRVLITIIALLILYSCSVQKEFYESGNLKARGKVKNDIKNGNWQLFYENGNIYQIGAYSNGRETGEWKIFHENGKIRQIGKFSNGKQTGEWNFFHPNGSREGIGLLLDGKKTGNWKWYFNNNQIQTERIWNKGKLTEIVNCYDGKGNELDKGTFANGNGTLKLYDIDGKLKETSRYKNGEYIE